MDNTWWFWKDEYFPENKNKTGIMARHTIMGEGKHKYTKEEIEKLSHFSRWIGELPKMVKP